MTMRTEPRVWLRERAVEILLISSSALLLIAAFAMIAAMLARP